MPSATPAPSVTLNVNGVDRVVNVESSTPLLFVLRNDLGLTAAKFGCGLEQCFACAVLIDGQVRTSCATAVDAVVGKRITTAEGLRLPGLREAFIEEQAAQCGYCIPGMLVGAAGLLGRNPRPNDAQVREALSPHLCRCGSHPRILRAVARACGA